MDGHKGSGVRSMFEFQTSSYITWNKLLILFELMFPYGDNNVICHIQL